MLSSRSESNTSAEPRLFTPGTRSISPTTNLTNFVCFFTTGGECTQYGAASITINANNTVNVSGMFSGTQQIGATAPVTGAPVTTTPEPSSLVLLGTGVLSAATAGGRRFRKA